LAEAFVWAARDDRNRAGCSAKAIASRTAVAGIASEKNLRENLRVNVIVRLRVQHFDALAKKYDAKAKKGCDD
jgi:hypothetical protein